MALVWPLTLPQRLLVEGYQETAPNTMLRTEMDAGPVKTRQRFTAGVRAVSGAIILRSKADLDTLDAFYVTDLKGGTLTFEMQDRNGDTQVFAFVEPPSYEFIEPDRIRVAMRLEIRP